MNATEFTVDLSDLPHSGLMTEIADDPLLAFFLLEDETDRDGTPIVEAVRTASGTQLIFACRFCGRGHLHGAMKARFGEADGHRVAHCFAADSPYKKTGYVLREVESLPKPFTRFDLYLEAGNYRSGYLRAMRQRLGEKTAMTRRRAPPVSR